MRTPAQAARWIIVSTMFAIVGIATAGFIQL